MKSQQQKYICTKKRYVFLKWKVLATYIVGHWAHVRPTFISTQTETVSLLSLIHNGVKYFLEEHSDLHGPMFSCDFFTIFIQFIKDPPKTNLAKTQPQGKNNKKTYSQRFYTSVSEISDQTQWSMCFHNNLKSGFREMSTSSSSYLMICVSSVARNNQLSDCFICTKQYIYIYMYCNYFKDLCTQRTFWRLIYALHWIRSLEIRRLK